MRRGSIKAKGQARPKEARRTIIGPRAAAALRLLIFTGVRLREILHLKWDHIDFERGLLLLPTSKTGKKTIVLNAPALAILSGLPRASDYASGFSLQRRRMGLVRDRIEGAGLSGGISRLNPSRRAPVRSSRRDEAADRLVPVALVRSQNMDW